MSEIAVPVSNGAKAYVAGRPGDNHEADGRY
jgi:hypothetical protein